MNDRCSHRGPAAALLPNYKLPPAFKTTLISTLTLRGHLTKCLVLLRDARSPATVLHCAYSKRDPYLGFCLLGRGSSCPPSFSSLVTLPIAVSGRGRWDGTGRGRAFAKQSSLSMSTKKARKGKKENGRRDADVCGADIRLGDVNPCPTDPQFGISLIPVLSLFQEIVVQRSPPSSSRGRFFVADGGGEQGAVHARVQRGERQLPRPQRQEGKKLRLIYFLIMVCLVWSSLVYLVQLMNLTQSFMAGVERDDVGNRFGRRDEFLCGEILCI